MSEIAGTYVQYVHRGIMGGEETGLLLRCEGECMHTCDSMKQPVLTHH